MACKRFSSVIDLALLLQLESSQECSEQMQLRLVAAWGLHAVLHPHLAHAVGSVLGSLLHTLLCYGLCSAQQPDQSLLVALTG